MLIQLGIGKRRARKGDAVSPTVPIIITPVATPVATPEPPAAVTVPQLRAAPVSDVILSASPALKVA